MSIRASSPRFSFRPALLGCGWFLATVACGVVGGKPTDPPPEGLDATEPSPADVGAVRVTNLPPSCQSGQAVAALVPNLDGLDRMFAVRLTPPMHPFTVKRVRYLLFPSGAAGDARYDRCTAPGEAMRQRVLVDVADFADHPPDAASVQPAAAIDVGPELVRFDPAFTEVVLPAPVVVADGKQLFVAVNIPGVVSGSDVDRATCLAVCTTDTPGLTEFMSKNKQPPFDWAALGPGVVKLEIEAWGD